MRGGGSKGHLRQNSRFRMVSDPELVALLFEARTATFISIPKYRTTWDFGIQEGLERSDVVSSLSCSRVLYDLKNAQQLARARRSAVSFSKGA